jgi:hypothetical protein
MAEGAEMNVFQVLESTWGQRTTRAAMIYTSVLLTIGGAVFTWSILDTKALVAKVALQTEQTAAVAVQAAADADAIKDGDTNRARMQDQFQADVRSSLRSINRRVDELVGDVGEVKGVLSEIQRDRSASSSTSSQYSRWPAATATP